MNTITKAFSGAIALCIAIQFVPYGHNHVNPPVVREPTWNSSVTRDLTKRVCFNCHSNETAWPLYSKIAPASWLIYHDVSEARQKLNFSDWKNGERGGENPHEIRKEIESGDMPPIQYRLAHPEVKLDDASKKALVAGLEATVNASIKR